MPRDSDFTILKSGFIVFITDADNLTWSYLWVQRHGSNYVKRAKIVPNRTFRKCNNNLEKNRLQGEIALREKSGSSGSRSGAGNDERSSLKY